jgi:hypothetical protein
MNKDTMDINGITTDTIIFKNESIDSPIGIGMTINRSKHNHRKDNTWHR